MHLDGKPKRDRQHHSLSKNASRRGALNGRPRPATASPNVPPLNRRQATRHHCASVRMSWSSGAAGALTEASSNCGHQIPRVGRKSLPGSTLERVRRPIAGSIPRTGPGRSSATATDRHHRSVVVPAPDHRVPEKQSDIGNPRLRAASTPLPSSGTPPLPLLTTECQNPALVLVPSPNLEFGCFRSAYRGSRYADLKSL